MPERSAGGVTPLPTRTLLWPLLGVLVAAWFAVYVVAFDQGTLGTSLTSAMSDSGGVLHELFHDARHLLGVPCH